MFIMFFIYMIYGGGTKFPSHELLSEPLYDISSLHKVIDLPYPPGNVAVSHFERIFITLHPEAHPPFQICEVNIHTDKSSCIPYPSKEFQNELDSVLSIRIAPDEHGNELLWILDYGNYGIGSPKLIAIDISTNKQVHRYDFDSNIAPLLSMLNDFQIDPKKQVIYIADAGIFRKQGAIIVYDIKSQTARRLLEGSHSVSAKNYKTIINSTDLIREMVILGVFTISPNVDSIALSRDGKWLYYASVNDDKLYKIFTEDLLDTNLDSTTLESRVLVHSNKTQSDGMTTDEAGNIYYGAIENSAILRINNKFDTPFTETLFQDDSLLRWPDGFSFGPNGYIYVACSSLHHVIFQSTHYISSKAPYHIFRFKTQYSPPAGQ